MAENEPLMVPGPRPDYPPTTDTEPWERFDGERIADNGVNLNASGYRWNPRDVENPLPARKPNPRPAPPSF